MHLWNCCLCGEKVTRGKNKKLLNNIISCASKREANLLDRYLTKKNHLDLVHLGIVKLWECSLQFVVVVGGKEQQ